MIQAISYSELIKLIDISTAKAIYDSLCGIYERKTQDGFLEEFSEEEAAKSLMTTWEDSDKMTCGKNDEEVNPVLMVIASSDESSDSRSESNGDDSE
ncbi:hypothetical protein A2U01_0040516, partial [Trifolium medium]|nr:hypothetical protein [Trifolium medium]